MKNLLSLNNRISRRPRWVRRWEQAQSCDIRLQKAVISNAEFETLEDRALLSALSGTYSVGATGNYASLTAAIADIQTQTISGAVTLELQSRYTSTGETFPLTFSNLGTNDVNGDGFVNVTDTLLVTRAFGRKLKGGLFRDD